MFPSGSAKYLGFRSLTLKGPRAAAGRSGASGSPLEVSQAPREPLKTRMLAMTARCDALNIVPFVVVRLMVLATSGPELRRIAPGVWSGSDSLVLTCRNYLLFAL